MVPVIPVPSSEVTDHCLVQACLNHDEHAWRMLIQKYKNLIYSFPRRYGAGPADAADVFQLVCAELFQALPRLRSCDSLRAWIMTVASHEAYRWKRRYVKRSQREGEDLETATMFAVEPPSDELERLERQQVVREALALLAPRCREMVQMLFFEDPPVPYQAVAAKLGLATGSIGLIRARCLKKVERALEQINRRPGEAGHEQRMQDPLVSSL
jgi:RNA polymerase sigma factor (sigma-70 family)